MHQRFSRKLSRIQNAQRDISLEVTEYATLNVDLLLPIAKIHNVTMGNVYFVKKDIMMVGMGIAILKRYVILDTLMVEMDFVIRKMVVKTTYAL